MGITSFINKYEVHSLQSNFSEINRYYFIPKVIIFWLENGKFEFSRKQYIFLKHSKREFCAEFYYHF
jgi:hypothetical protein